MTLVKLLIFFVVLMFVSLNVFATGGGGGGGGGVTGSSVPSLSFNLQIAVIVFIAYLYRKRK